MALTKAPVATAPAKTETKVWELIESGPRVPFFKTFEDGSRMQVENYDDYTPHMVYTFTDVEGNSRTIRFLKASNEIDQDKQIKAGFDANIKITEADRSELRFKRNKLYSNKKNVQAFMAACPGNEAFEGDRGDYQVIFREYLPKILRKRTSDLALRQAKAIVALEEFTEEEMDSKLIRIMGADYLLPTEIDGKKEALLDEINVNETCLDIILEAKESITQDSIEVVLGKAINKKAISFIENPGQVMIKRNGTFVKLLSISEEHTEEQKIQIFTDTLRTEEGKVILAAIKEALAAS